MKYLKYIYLFVVVLILFSKTVFADDNTSVPEPTSLAIFGIFSVIGFCLGYFKREKK